MAAAIAGAGVALSAAARERSTFADKSGGMAELFFLDEGGSATVGAGAGATMRAAATVGAKVRSSHSTISVFEERKSAKEAVEAPPEVRRAAAEKICRLMRKKVAMAKSADALKAKCKADRSHLHPEREVFFVRMIPIEAYPLTMKMLDDWKKEMSEYPKMEGLSDSHIAKIKDALFMTGFTKEYLDLKYDETDPMEYRRQHLIGAFDKKGRIQAVAIFTREVKSKRPKLNMGYTIECLLTAPHNLRLSFQTPGVKGAATALIEEVVFRAIRHTVHCDVKLGSTRTAVSFYEHLGFRVASEEGGHLVLRDAGLRFFLATHAGSID